jgi:type I restriction enzyme S subunit
MNADRLLEHYNSIADAPDAIPRLRRFILDLAVRGKLVPQDPTDEPSSELLKRIMAEKARLAKAGQIRKDKPLPAIPAEALPFKLPSGWAWERLGNIGETNIGLTYSPQNISELGIPVLRSSNIQNGKLDFSDLVRVKDEPKQSVMVQQGDLLICARNGSRALVGKVAVIEDLKEPAAFGAFMAIFRSEVNQYLYHFICSPLFRQVIAEVNTTTINQITQNNLRSTLAPIPPLAEQHRIVAKVDELMALCDRLEAARAGREAVRDSLAAASLARLNAPDPVTFQDDARFALAALPAFTTRPDQIKQLRQTILNLAVRGKLVPQNSNDEPASELLKRIAKEKHTKKTALDRGHTDAGAINGYHQTFELPIGWNWVRLEEITEIGTGLTPSKAQQSYYSGGRIPWINSSATSGDVIREAKYFVTQQAVKDCRLKIYPAGSLIVALYGQGKTRGQVAELGIDATVNQACAVVQWFPSFRDLKGFVRLTLEQQYDAMRERAEGGPQPNLNVGKIKERTFALPPLDEQHRIVAKVDELMALCDRLEASLDAAATTRRRLLDALLHETLAPVDDREMEAAE